jgi:signal transduction histidine kinase
VFRSGLFWRIFLGTLTAGLSSVLIVSLVTREAFLRALGTYMGMQSTHHGVGMMGPGRAAMRGAAEQAFLASVDRGVILGGVTAAIVAAVVAFLLARAISDPLQHLEHGAAMLATGHLGHRITVSGPQEIIDLGDSFNAMAHSLQDTESSRRRMIADVAHEIRNPLAAARVQAEGMAEGVLAPEPERLASLVDDLAHLSHVVDDLQELTLAEAGRLSYDMQRLDIAALAVTEARRAQPLATPGVLIKSVIPDAQVIVVGDESRLSQVLRNLIGNAVRHTPSGTIDVQVAVVGRAAEVRVQDTGPGIDPNNLPHIFERFYRADAARTTDTGGIGLGLSISRRIVEDHGGEVFAESQPGHGATVGFRLPLGS